MRPVVLKNRRRLRVYHRHGRGNECGSFGINQRALVKRARRFEDESRQQIKSDDD